MESISVLGGLIATIVRTGRPVTLTRDETNLFHRQFSAEMEVFADARRWRRLRLLNEISGGLCVD